MCYGTARTMYRTRAYAPYTRTFATRVRPFLLLLPSLSLSFPSRLLSLSLSMSTFRPPSLSSLPYLASSSLSLRRHKDRTQ